MLSSGTEGTKEGRPCAWVQKGEAARGALHSAARAGEGSGEPTDRTERQLAGGAKGSGVEDVTQGVA